MAWFSHHREGRGTSPERGTTNRNVPNSHSQDAELTYPEGGLEAWGVVFGSFCLMFSAFGVINTAAVFQFYYSQNQFSQYSQSRFPGYFLWPIQCHDHDIAMRMTTALGLWLTTGDSEQIPLALTILLGFTSGGNFSLIPVCIGQLCDPRNYGRYFSTDILAVSLGTLTGIPIGGSLFMAQRYWMDSSDSLSGLSYAFSL